MVAFVVLALEVVAAFEALVLVVEAVAVVPVLNLVPDRVLHLAPSSVVVVLVGICLCSSC